MDDNLNNNNIDDIDAIFGVVNSNPEAAEERRNHRLQEDAKRENLIRQSDELNKPGALHSGQGYGIVSGGTTGTTTMPNVSEEEKTRTKKIADKTVGTNKKTKTNNKSVPSEVVIDIRPFMNKALAVVIAAVITISAGSLYMVSNGEQIREQKEVKEFIDNAVNTLETKAMFNLIYNNLATIDPETDKFVVNTNAVDDYWKLNITNPIDVYSYYLVLPTAEFEKFIQTITYNDGICAYLSTSQYLRINGYFNKNGEPSIAEFDKYIKDKIANISGDVFEEFKNNPDILTYGDMLELMKSETADKGIGGR